MNATRLSNPFATRYVRPGSLEFRFLGQQDDSASPLLQLLDQVERERASLIVGPHGTGKTTLLHSLEPWLKQRFAEVVSVRLAAPETSGPITRLRQHRRTASLVLARQAGLRDGGLLVVDGIEQLRRVDRARLLRATARRDQSILATGHTPLAGLSVVYETKVSGQLIKDLTISLLVDAAPKIDLLVQQQLHQQDWTRLTNVRDFWFDLYDIVQPHILRSVNDRSGDCQNENAPTTA